MSLKKKELLRKMVIGFFLIVTSLLLLRLAYLLVGDSNNEIAEVIETEQYSTEEVISDTTDIRGIPLYDYESVGTSVRLEGSEDFDTVVNQIEMVVSRVFEGITDIPYDYSNMKLIGILKNDKIGFEEKEFLTDYTSFFIENSLTVIGMMGNRYVITVWDYPKNESKEIVVIDYENIEVYQEQEYVLELGDVISVRGCVGQYEVKSLSGFNVMFLKG